MILVTGATGFIGRAIVARLLSAGNSMAVLARARDGLDASTRLATVLGDAVGRGVIEIVEGDLTAIDATLAPSDLRRLRRAYVPRPPR